jgi:hypothetical protein
VAISSETVTTTTDENGFFSLRVPPGAHTIKVTYEGAVCYEAPLQVGSGGVELADIVVDDIADIDGDGLANSFETEGWTIQLDLLGMGTENEFLTSRIVSSDPDAADTDGDGLDDGAEFLIRSDPRSIDSDKDGLDDDVEWIQYKSNPASVDSDSDARGPDGTKFPNQALFDGNEILELRTSPTLADTDGDSKTDLEEFEDPSRNPLVAELPTARLEFMGELDVRLRVEYEETQGQETEYGEVFTQSTTDSTSRSDSRSVAETTAASGGLQDMISKKPDPKNLSKKAIKFNKGVAIGVAAAPVVAKAIGLGDEYGQIAEGLGLNPTPETTTTTTVSTTQTSTKTAQEEHSRYQRDSQTHTERSASGEVSIGFRVSNPSPYAYTFHNLFVTMGQWQPNGEEFKTLATLKADIEELVLSPGETSPLMKASSIDVNAAVIKEFLKNPRALFMDPAGYDLQNEEGISFKFLTETTAARTALIVIDYGLGVVERHRVATNVDRLATDTPNPDDPDVIDRAGTPSGVKMSAILEEILGIPYEMHERQAHDENNDPMFDGNGDAVMVSILTKVRTIENRINDEGGYWPGEPKQRVDENGDPVWTTNDDGEQIPVGALVQDPQRFWVVYSSRDSQSKTDLDFDEIVVRAGDEIHLVFTRDEDGDGLFAAEEFVYGSTDDPADELTRNPDERDSLGRISYTPGADDEADSVDTDRDGLTDFEEAREGWTVTYENRQGTQTSYDVTSSPATRNGDDDELNDWEERKLGTDPNDPDSDGDGIVDDLDPLPLISGRRLYVSAQDGDDTNSGEDWGDEYRTLQKALADAQESRTALRVVLTDHLGSPAWLANLNDSIVAVKEANGGELPADVYDAAVELVNEIWVAAGTYKPNDGVQPDPGLDANFRLVGGVAIYGGFLGFEERLAERNPDALSNDTILSGDVGVTGDDSDNVRHVVRSYLATGTPADEADRSARLDGFLITGGNASDGFGAGILIERAGPTLANLLVVDNQAAIGGGGMADIGGHALVTDCIFSDNRSGFHGGGLWAESSRSEFVRSTFEYNRVPNGEELRTFVEPNGDTNQTGFNWGHSTLGHHILQLEVDGVGWVFVFSLYERREIGLGGGVFAFGDGRMIFEGCRIRNNAAHIGAGVYLGSGRFVDSPSGGERYTEFAKPLIQGSYRFSRCRISGNNTQPGTIYDPGYQGQNFAGDDVEATKVLLELASRGHLHGRTGGGIFNTARLSLAQCAVTHNEGVVGGGIYATEGSWTSLLNCTFAANRYAQGGASLHVLSDATATLRNCIATWAAEDQRVFKDEDNRTVSIGANLLSTVWIASSIDVRTTLFTEVPNPYWTEASYYGNGNVFDSGFQLENGLYPPAGSAAIDAGSRYLDFDPLETGFQTATEDLFGEPRFVDGNDDGEAEIDMGAVELQK